MNTKFQHFSVYCFLCIITTNITNTTVFTLLQDQKFNSIPEYNLHLLNWVSFLIYIWYIVARMCEMYKFTIKLLFMSFIDRCQRCEFLFVCVCVCSLVRVCCALFNVFYFESLDFAFHRCKFMFMLCNRHSISSNFMILCNVMLNLEYFTMQFGMF